MIKNEKIKIELTKEHYFALLKAVYLGNWMANTQRDGSPEDQHIQEYEEISDYIFSLAPQFGFEKYVDHDKVDGSRYFPTRFFEEKTDVDTLHEEYDEENFWDELFYKMSDRDFFREYSEKEISKMNLHERFEKEEPFREKWDKEINDHGIERLEIKENK